jgi:hypothetical protein
LCCGCGFTRKSDRWYSYAQYLIRDCSNEKLFIAADFVRGCGAAEIKVREGQGVADVFIIVCVTFVVVIILFDIVGVVFVSTVAQGVVVAISTVLPIAVVVSTLVCAEYQSLLQ